MLNFSMQQPVCFEKYMFDSEKSFMFDTFLVRCGLIYLYWLIWVVKLANQLLMAFICCLYALIVATVFFEGFCGEVQDYRIICSLHTFCKRRELKFLLSF